MREVADASAPRRPRLELGRRASAESASRVDRGSDDRPTVLVQVEDPPRPLRRRRYAVAEERDGVGLGERRQLLLLLGKRGFVSAHDRERSPDPPLDRHIALEHRVAELRQPQPSVVDQVEREPITAGWDRPAHLDVGLDPLSRRDRMWQVGAEAVPDDRVAAVVEPVVCELDSDQAALRPPRREPGVLERDPYERDCAGANRRQLVRAPANREWAGRNDVLADLVHRRTSVGRMQPLLVRAARREPVERTPVWFMRQAGRSLPEYREIRKGRTLFETVRDPAVCAEVTLQPVRRYDVDAAVMFADIMFPVVGMGIDVELVENVGPVVAQPIATRADVQRLRVPDPDETVPEILEAVRLVRDELREDQAVVGFCGGPFTVGGYLIEGKPSREFVKVKTLMYSEAGVWHSLMEKLSETFALYVQAKVRAGADVIQVFDSWVGALSPQDYDEFVAPHSARLLAAVDVPTIHFGTGTSALLGAMADAGGDVIGLDWRIPLDRGWDAVGDERGVQGNLDPAVLLAPWERVRDTTQDVLERARGRRGHIFNLGHGVLPQTDPDVLRRLAAFVQEATVEARV